MDVTTRCSSVTPSRRARATAAGRRWSAAHDTDPTPGGIHNAMKLGFLTAPLPDTPLEDVAEWAGANGFESLEKFRGFKLKESAGLNISISTNSVS